MLDSQHRPANGNQVANIQPVSGPLLELQAASRLHTGGSRGSEGRGERGACGPGQVQLFQPLKTKKSKSIMMLTPPSSDVAGSGASPVTVAPGANA